MAQLRDIYRYFSGWDGGKGNDLPFRGAYDAPADSSFLRQTGADLGLGAENERNQVHWSIKPGSFLDSINQQYGNAINFDPNVRNNDSGSDQGWLNIDYSKLPKTRFGTVDNTVAVTEGSHINDPRFVYDDPVYGRITHKGNVNTGANAFVGPGLLAGLTMGAGSLLGGSGLALANTAMRGGQAALKGNPLAALASLGSVLGMPSWGTMLARLAASRFGGRG
jgi:hypothetical protein